LIDGLPSAHHILNDDPNNMSGNRVLSRSWARRGANEWVNTRSFTITLGATIQESYSTIVAYRETVGQRGTGGEHWTYVPRWQGAPVRTSIHQQTPVELFQEGWIVGLNALPALPPPYWADDEQQRDRYIARFSPRFHGHLDFDRGTHYGLKYRYRFLRAVAPNQEPTSWPV
jgi:hypothetical protein